jgi:hypothetical protein
MTTNLGPLAQAEITSFIAKGQRRGLIQLDVGNPDPRRVSAPAFSIHGNYREVAKNVFFPLG